MHVLNGKTFIFWIKTGYAVMYGITLIMYRHHITKGFPLLEGVELGSIILMNILGTVLIARYIVDCVHVDLWVICALVI